MYSLVGGHQRFGELLYPSAGMTAQGDQMAAGAQHFANPAFTLFFFLIKVNFCLPSVHIATIDCQ
jgi:hypothetical protein